MNKLLLARVLMAVAIHFFAQASVAVTARQNDFEGELSRIQANRAQQETQYQKEEAICYGKFAVTDCLHAVRARRRESFELLRKQEVALRQAQRQFKAAQQLERLKEKSAEDRSAQNAANRLEAMQAQKAREERLEIASQKARTQLQQTSNVSQDRKKTHYQGRSEADRAQERKQFQEKQDQAREQRAKREKTRLEKSGTKAKPLPPAP